MQSVQQSIAPLLDEVQGTPHLTQTEKVAIEEKRSKPPNNTPQLELSNLRRSTY
jgi:hypothetical protein